MPRFSPRLLALAITVIVAAASAVLAPAEAGTPAGVIRTLGTVADASPSVYDGTPYGSPDLLDTYVTPSGDLGVVRVDPRRHRLAIRTYDADTHRAVGSARTIFFGRTPLFGGVYTAPDGAHFLLTGRGNVHQDDHKAVVFVQRFTPAWKAAGSATLAGRPAGLPSGIVQPFDYTAPAMLQVANRLVVHMARTQYTSGDGLRHQVNLTFEVDLTTMKATTFDKLGHVAYSSHSFHQLLASSGRDLVLLDHGDAYPRGLQLSIMKDYPTARDVTSRVIFPFTGAVGDNATGTEVTGLVGGPSGILTVGTSVPHRHAVRGVTGSGSRLAKNVFVISSNLTNTASRFRWVTNLAPRGHATPSEPRIVQVAPDRYALLFSVHSGSHTSMEYRLLDSRGRVLARHTWKNSYFSPASQPVPVGSTVYWAGLPEQTTQGHSATVYLQGVDCSDPGSPRRLGPRRYTPSTDSALQSVKVAGGRLLGHFTSSKTSYQVRATHKYTGVTSLVTRDPNARVAYRYPGTGWIGEERFYRIGRRGHVTEQVRVTAERHRNRTVYSFHITRR